VHADGGELGSQGQQTMARLVILDKSVLKRKSQVVGEPGSMLTAMPPSGAEERERRAVCGSGGKANARRLGSVCDGPPRRPDRTARLPMALWPRLQSQPAGRCVRTVEANIRDSGRQPDQISSA